MKIKFPIPLRCVGVPLLTVEVLKIVWSLRFGSFKKLGWTLFCFFQTALNRRWKSSGTDNTGRRTYVCAEDWGWDGVVMCSWSSGCAIKRAHLTYEKGAFLFWTVRWVWLKIVAGAYKCCFYPFYLSCQSGEKFPSLLDAVWLKQPYTEQGLVSSWQQTTDPKFLTTMAHSVFFFIYVVGIWTVYEFF